jgi:hypothetical protein
MSARSEPVINAHYPRWADRLHRLGLDNLTAWALEASGPLALVGAQALHFGGVFFRPALSDSALNNLVNLLEDDEERQRFVHYLRKEGQA